MATDFDLIVIGGGIGGSALATAMARAGSSVLLLEKSTVFRDHVRGEWMAPWGVAELMRLDLYDTVRAGGGHHVKYHWGCDEDVPPDEAVAQAIDLSVVIPEVPGPLCIGHPAHCQLLFDAAAAAGATVRRGVADARIDTAARAVTYYLDGGEHRATARLVIGADGRGSQVRKQLGIELHRDPNHHLFAGMLVEGAHGWPEDTQVIGAEGDVHYLAFPQGQGRVRLYLGYSSEQPKRLVGAAGPAAFLHAFHLKSVPYSEHLANARPAGPCNSYPNEDTWTDTIARDNVVLLGDAAGSNDPILGQGLSITMRDVRLVRDILLAETDWSSSEIFTPYADERSERMRRLRISAALIATMENEFGDEARARRQRIRERQMQDPSLLLPLLAAFVGPDNVPAEVFEEEMRRRLLA